MIEHTIKPSLFQHFWANTQQTKGFSTLLIEHTIKPSFYIYIYGKRNKTIASWFTSMDTLWNLCFLIRRRVTSGLFRSFRFTRSPSPVVGSLRAALGVEKSREPKSTQENPENPREPRRTQDVVTCLFDLSCDLPAKCPTYNGTNKHSDWGCSPVSHVCMYVCKSVCVCLCVRVWTVV